MQRQLSQLTRITDDLRDMTQINRGQLALHPTRIDLAEVIRAGVESVLDRSGAKHQTVTIDVPEQPLQVVGDRGRLVQVLTNLLMNAVKFTPDRGTIAVRASRDAARIRVDVSDSGIGIAPDLLPHVFDAFRQADNSDSGKREGMGLGLNIVKKLVEAHGGSVRASSGGVGTGACLTIWLPGVGEDDEQTPRRTSAAAR
jgi:signal transduction histidine kinase